ncbi:PALP-domain-containing protein [Viridothelium virens]|uniref:Cysteine synthase 2 n=1 Tax=Viridothelium virens TaxID=1048519 RepID=A0A6A6HAJ8_VIRVR|nr:PALP-domain-containing protein [Viridothelium virens]
MDQYSRWSIVVAFATGVFVSVAFQAIYAHGDKEQRQRKSSTQSASSRNVEVRSLESSSIKEGIEGCIGNTPLVRIKSLSEETGCEILAKAEFLNGAGNSPKDRAASSIISMAEEQGLLRPNSGDVIYEGTVGSTGISLAAIARARGYNAHICMPSDQSTEKSSLLLHLGATVDRVPPASIIDPNHFVNRARTLAAAHTTSPTQPGRGFFADQFETAANWRAHFEGTGPEILAQAGGQLDAFVAGAGTGGTISGVARCLKGRLGRGGVRIVLADPQGSGLWNKIKYGVMFDVKEREGTRRRHQVDSIVEGIGLNRMTENFEAGRTLIDDAVRVTDEQAMAMAQWLVEKDGIFAGSSSAVNCVAATKVALELGPGHRIVTLLCDPGTRHLSKFWAKAGTVGNKTDTKLVDVLHTDGS